MRPIVEKDNTEFNHLLEKILNYLSPKEFIFVGFISVVCSLVMVLAPDSVELFRYQKLEVTNGQVWRIFTANLSHSNWNHWLLNFSGLILIDYLLQPYLKQSLRAKLLVFCMLANVTMLHFMMNLHWYVGLSGALHGYLVGGALLSWSKAKVSNSLILIVVFGKLFAELNWEINQSTAGLIDANVVEEAHLAGAVSAIIFFAAIWLYQKLGKKRAL